MAPIDNDAWRSKRIMFLDFYINSVFSEIHKRKIRSKTFKHVKVCERVCFVLQLNANKL